MDRSNRTVFMDGLNRLPEDSVWKNLPGSAGYSSSILGQEDP